MAPERKAETEYTHVMECTNLEITTGNKISANSCNNTWKQYIAQLVGNSQFQCTQNAHRMKQLLEVKQK